jgi:hypothetical protein
MHHSNYQKLDYLPFSYLGGTGFLLGAQRYLKKLQFSIFRSYDSMNCIITQIPWGYSVYPIYAFRIVSCMHFCLEKNGFIG